MGLKRAGFDEIFGIDIEYQPDYPFQMKVTHVFSVIPEVAGSYFDFIWASPPCHAYSCATLRYRNSKNDRHITYPDLINKTRELLIKTGIPFVIENVPGAPLRKDLILCGEMFGLKVIRHRIFEIHGFKVKQPLHKRHRGLVKDGYYVTVAGNGGNYKDHNFCKLNDLPLKTSKLKVWQHAMGINWINDKKMLDQAVPPKYAEYIGRQFLQLVK